MANELSGSPLGVQTFVQLNAAEQTFKPVGAAFNLLEKLKKGRSCNIVINGDSTSTVAGGTATTNSSWAYRLISEYLAPQFPEVTFNMFHNPNAATGAFDSTAAIQTGSGSGVCNIYNVSYGGINPTFWFGGAFKYSVFKGGNFSADLIIMNHGFNISTTSGSRYGAASYMAAVLDEMQSWHPEAGIVVVVQNPKLSEDVTGGASSSATLISRACELAAKMKNADLLRFYDFFVANGKPAGWYYDDTHPSAAVASPLMAKFAWQTIFHMVGSQRNPSPTTIGRRTGDNFLTNAKFDTYSAGAATGWTATNCTLSEDTADFETGSRALVMTCSSNAAAYIEQAINGNALKLLSGRYVTFGARMRVPNPSPSNSGIVGAVRTGLTEEQSPRMQGTLDGRTKYHWKFAGINLPEITNTSVDLLFRVYAANAVGSPSSANGIAVAVDRVVLIPGTEPLDTV